MEVAGDRGPVAILRDNCDGRQMQSLVSAISSALQGQECRVTRREFDWQFDFGERLSISVPVPWRVVTPDGIAHASGDDGQRFGHSKPIDGEARTNQLLRGRKVIASEIDQHTADLRVGFDGGTRLDFFNNSSGYEGWEVWFAGADGLVVTALGGGKLSTWRRTSGS